MHKIIFVIILTGILCIPSVAMAKSNIRGMGPTSVQFKHRYKYPHRHSHGNLYTPYYGYRYVPPNYGYRYAPPNHGYGIYGYGYYSPYIFSYPYGFYPYGIYIF